MISTKNKQLSQKYKAQGNQCILNENYDKAIDWYNKAIQMDPTNPVFFNNRALAFFKKQMYSEALIDAEESIRLNPKYIKAYLKKIESLIQLDQVNRARITVEEAMQIEANNDDLISLKNTIENQLRLVNSEISQIQILPWQHPEMRNQQNLIQWLKENKQNNQFPKLRLTFFSENYRGVIACRKIYKKQRILFIHRSNMITLQMSRQHPTSVKILKSDHELLSPKHTFLAIYLMSQKNKTDSNWAHYINILPSHYRNFPIFFDQPELAELQGSNFLFQIKQKVVDLKKDYDTVCTIDPDFAAKYTFREFCWARITVCSRIFGLVIDGIKTDALVPLADMLNHRIPKQTSWNFSQQLQGFVIESLEDIPRGQEVFDSYGKKCNSRFFLNYGFILKNNEANECFKFRLNPDDPHYVEKRNMIGEKEQLKIFRVNKIWEQASFIEMLGYLRFLNVQGHQLNQLKGIKRQQDLFRPTRTPPLDLKLQLMVWKSINSAVIENLNGYPTTLDKDKQLLNLQLTQNIRNCILLRMGEKSLYYHYKRISEKMINFLNFPAKQIKKQSSKAQYKECSSYIQKIVLTLAAHQ